MAVPATKAAAFITAFVLLGVLLGKLFYTGEVTETVRLEADPECDLRAGPCELTLDGDRHIAFGIQPRDIPVGRTLQLSVDLDRLEADKVAVDINGVDMDMGLLPYPLKPVGPHHYEGPGGLNFCSRGIMEWEARVRVTKGNREIIAPFRFITVAPDPAIPLENNTATGHTAPAEQKIAL